MLVNICPIYDSDVIFNEKDMSIILINGYRLEVFSTNEVKIGLIVQEGDEFYFKAVRILNNKQAFFAEVMNEFPVNCILIWYFRVVYQDQIVVFLNAVDKVRQKK